MNQMVKDKNNNKNKNNNNNSSNSLVIGQWPQTKMGFLMPNCKLPRISSPRILAKACRSYLPM